MKKRVVIIGAGYAGVLTAKKLERLVRKAGLTEQIEIRLIDRNPYHTMLTELHEVAAARVAEENITVSLEKIFAGRQVEISLDEVCAVDLEAKIVRGRDSEYSFDYLVLAAGSRPTFFGISGAEEHCYKLWSYQDALRLNERVLSVFRQAALESDAAKRRQLLSFNIIGAGFTGVEMAGELAEYLQVLCRRFEMKHEECGITLLDILERTVPNLSEKQSHKVEKRLAKMGVRCLLGAQVRSVDEKAVCYLKDSVEGRAEGETSIWAAGIEAADITQSLTDRLASPSRSRGRIELSPDLSCPDNPSVYVAGDNMFYVAKDEERPVAQMVENCEQCSAVIAKNLFVDLSGRGDKEAYRPSFHGVMVSVGSRYGVAEIGSPRKMFSLASFFAMFVKHFINVIYYIQICGWNKVFSYLKHEFFTIRDHRSFLGGHFSNVTPSFLLLPLRLWLGLVWIYEALMKITAGWFEKPMLDAFFNGARGWYDSILSGAPMASSVADASSSASTAGESAGELLLNINLLLGRLQIVSGKLLAEAGLHDLALRFQMPLIDLFVDKLILPSERMQIFMQISIVILELLIGLCLFSGFFTFVSSSVSLVLQFMFITTTGLYFSTLWMIFAAVAVWIGGGRALGLDYYLMPALKAGWKKIPFMKKWYLYHD